jgi:hypothetical protein
VKLCMITSCCTYFLSVSATHGAAWMDHSSLGAGCFTELKLLYPTISWSALNGPQFLGHSVFETHPLEGKRRRLGFDHLDCIGWRYLLGHSTRQDAQGRSAADMLNRRRRNITTLEN